MRKPLSGLYFVIDMVEAGERAKEIINASIKGGVDIIQIWGIGEKIKLGELVKIREITKQHRIPLIVNNDIELASRINADGVHMDSYEMSPSEIRSIVGKDSIVGYTVGNDLDRVRWAERCGADYISFCAIFPSPSVSNCEIVPLKTVMQAREISSIPIFASGGINLHNARQVLEAGADGLAVISAIQRAYNPEMVCREFKRIISNYHKSKSALH